jgi:hypothetical protein
VGWGERLVPVSRKLTPGVLLGEVGAFAVARVTNRPGRLPASVRPTTRPRQFSERLVRLWMSVLLDAH